VVLEIHNENSYPLKAILEWLGPLPVVKETPEAAPYKHNFAIDDRVKMAKLWLSHQSPAIQGSGGDHATFVACCAVTRGHDLGADAAYAALVDWNARCEPPWDEAGLRDKIQASIQYASGQRGELLAPENKRRMTLTRLSQMQIQPVFWCWQDRLALGELALLGGREGIGKSMLAYWLAAEISTGRLPGDNFKTARSVIISATEDSYEHTIVPRLMAAKADLNKIFRVEVENTNGTHSGFILPKDNQALQDNILENDVAMVLLDPLMSRLAPELDTHKDGDVRRALEPLAKIAHDTKCVMLGIIHVNKSQSADPLTMLMGSRAFVAMARQVLFVMSDPENTPKGRMLGQAKNNLGVSSDLPTKLFHIDNVFVGRTDEGDVYTGKLVWDGDTTNRNIVDEIETNQTGVDRDALSMAMEFLHDIMEMNSDIVEASVARHQGKRQQIGRDSLEKARKKMKVNSIRAGFAGGAYWCKEGITKEMLIEHLKEKSVIKVGEEM
jgi:hypothetical protein